MKKNDAWNIRRLVDESFVPATQRIILKIVGFQTPDLPEKPYIYAKVPQLLGYLLEKRVFVVAKEAVGSITYSPILFVLLTNCIMHIRHQKPQKVEHFHLG